MNRAIQPNDRLALRRSRDCNAVAFDALDACGVALRGFTFFFVALSVCGLKLSKPTKM